MKFKYKVRKRKNMHPLLVSCASCKRDVLIYQKGTKGGLIKLQFKRIYESEVDINSCAHLNCPFCGALLAMRGKFEGGETFWVLRGALNSKILSHYKE